MSTGLSLVRRSSETAALRRGPAPSDIADVIVRAVAYGDVFDYPLSVAEAWRNAQIDVERARFDAALRLAIVSGRLSWDAGWLSLPGRDVVREIRRARAEHARRLWSIAVRVGDWLGRLPFVRHVAVSGALAVDNVEPGADIDLFLITAPGRVWTCRALVLAANRLAERFGATLCPNYLVSSRVLVLPERNLFTAHELTQLVPLQGQRAYLELRERNRWTHRWLPNAGHRGAPAGARAALDPGAFERWWARRKVADRLERWEMERKVARWRFDAGPEADFAADRCKGHFRAHGHRVLTAYASRLAALGLEEPSL